MDGHDHAQSDRHDASGTSFPFILVMAYALQKDMTVDASTDTTTTMVLLTKYLRIFPSTQAR